MVALVVTLTGGFITFRSHRSDRIVPRIRIVTADSETLALLI